MEYGFLSRAGKFLQEQTKSRRWTMVFLCLAAGVTLGTLGFLKLYGQAMTHKVKMLDCQYEVHEHTEDCYEENEDGEKVLICGLADYVIHVHNDDCYDQKGNLVCTLEEHELHEHDDSCWEEVEVLICDEEESEGSKETETDAEAEKPADAEEDVRDAEEETGSDAEIVKELACEKEEHKHDDSCYADGAGCEKEVHTHDDSCYETTETLVCSEEEHTHDDSCYSEGESELTCGESEHTHDDDCYDEDGNLTCEEAEHEHDDSCYSEGESEVICGKDEHTHGDGCYEVEETLVCEIEEHEHDDSCAGESELICEIEEHEHDDSCYAETEAETEKKAESEPAEETKSEETVKEEDTQEKKEEAEKEEGHKHTDDCYETQKVLTCGELELHTHDADPESETCCYTEDCFDEEGNLIEGSRPSCGLLQLEEHIHTEECFKTVELTPEEIAAINGGATLHIHTDECYDGEGNLICGHEVTHLHQLECYDEDGNLICGFGGASHVHEESCYDEEGNLVCGYETATHLHTADCYDEEGNLICGYETAVHPHTADCYDEEGNLVCGYDAAVHPHTADCYDEEGNLICGYKTAVHPHTADCYDEEGNLVCGYDAAVHPHTVDCYDEEGNLICGYKTAEHPHTPDCYDEEGNLICGYETAVHEHEESCYDKDGNLICGYGSLKVHEHDINCYDEEGNLICGYENARNHEHDINCYDEDGNLVCGYEGVKDHEHTEACYDEDGNLICGYQLELIYDNTRIYEGEGYIVTARYNDDANIPEEAVLFAKQITSENDKEHYDRRNVEFKQMLDGENVALKALFRVGFYIGDGEIEPESPVSVTIQFLDESGLKEGKPITVIHFAEEGTEKLKGSDAENNSTTFRMRSFSEIAIGYETDDVTIPISESYEYESDDFYTVFHIEGEVTLPIDKIKAENPETEADLDETEAGNALDDAEAAEESDTTVAEEGNEAADENSPEAPEANHDLLVQQLEFSVKPLNGDSEEYAAFAAYAEDKEEEDLSVLQVMSYTLSYEGRELDLSGCMVTVLITPTSALLDSAGEYIQTYIAENGETIESGLAINVYERTETGDVSGLDGLYITEDVLEEAENSIADYSLRSFMLDDTEESITSEQEGDTEQTSDAEETDSAKQEEVLGAEENLSPVTMKVQLTGRTFAAKATGSKANPSFQVQYYAWLDRIDTSADPDVYTWKTAWGTTNSRLRNSLIDTTGKVLPKNGVTPALKYFNVGNDGRITSNEILTKIYEEKMFSFAEAPNRTFFDEISYAENGSKGSYTLKEIWVTDKESVAAGTDRNAWKVYDDPETTKFTNRKETYNSDEKHYVYITADTYIRLVYTVTSEDKFVSSTFYDYDIGTGGWTETKDNDGNTVKTMNTTSAGINSASNCEAEVKYAFGNANTGTKYKDNVWTDSDGKSNLLNAGNRAPGGSDSHLLCTFGLVSGVDGKNLKFNVAAPSVFGESADGVAGKAIYDDYELIFNRKGDTYTLKSVYNDEFGHVANNLDVLKHPVYGDTTYYWIWSNLFWPMDKEREKYPDGHDFMFGGYGQKKYQLYDAAKGLGFPESDDGVDHNSYFGMYYEVTFDLSEDYTGPLEYYFFGDDDMWVFLDGQLVCDIGGVHLVVGEYVNLWDYLGTPNEDGTGKVDADKIGEHKLQFFYTERGASGSTCWMQFTLPSVETKAEQIDGQITNNLKVGKTLAGADNKIPEGLEYEFQINFKNSKGPLMNNYSYAKMDSEGNIVEEINSEGVMVPQDDVLIWDGGTFKLGDGEHIEVHYLPVGTTYTIKETGRAFKKGSDKPLSDEEKGKYDIIVDTGNGKDEGEVEGNLSAPSQSGGSIEVNYINDYGYELPETGGPGTEVYAAAGVLLILLGAGFVYKKKFRERRV